MKKLIIIFSIVFVFTITVTMLTISTITVDNSVEGDLLHIVHEIDKGVHFLFYTFFIKGTDPDCIDLICDTDGEI